MTAIHKSKGGLKVLLHNSCVKKSCSSHHVDKELSGNQNKTFLKGFEFLLT